MDDAGLLVWLGLTLVERCLDIWKKYFLKTCWHECFNAESIKLAVILSSSKQL